MKRPFAVFGLALFFVMVAIARVNSMAVTCAVLAGSVVLLPVSFCVKRSRRSGVLPTVFLAATVGCLLLLCVSWLAVRPARAALGEKTPVVAVARSYPEKGSNPKRRYITASIQSIGGKQFRSKLRLSLPAKETANCDCTFEIVPGDTIEFVGTVYEIGGGQWDIQRSFYSRNIFLGAYPTERVTRTAGGVSLRYGFVRARYRMVRYLRQNLPADAAGLAISVLLGDKSALPDGVYADFKGAGIAHIMAVSGLHLSIWTFLGMWLLSRGGKNKRKAAALSMAFVLAVMALALFSGSVLRAGLMLLVYLGGFLLRRTPDSLDSLGFAAAVILLAAPTLCMGVGFILSVLSTLAILTLALPLVQPAKRRLERSRAPRPVKAVLTAALTTAAISVCVSVVTLPVQVDSFETVSLVSVLSNLLILPAVMPLLLCSGGFAATASVPVLSTVMKRALGVLTHYCFWVAHSCSHLPNAVLVVSRQYAWAALLGSGLICAALALLLRAMQKKAKRDPLRMGLHID